MSELQPWDDPIIPTWQMHPRVVWLMSSDFITLYHDFEKNHVNMARCNECGFQEHLSKMPTHWVELHPALWNLAALAQ